jgi:hypothetical protein
VRYPGKIAVHKNSRARRDALRVNSGYQSTRAKKLDYDLHQGGSRMLPGVIISRRASAPFVTANT